MNHPIFHPNEEARIGPHAYDRRMAGRECKIESLVSPEQGEWRYAVSTQSGMCTIVLESTLQKLFKRSDWGAMKSYWYGKPDCYIWRPKREAR